MLLKQILWKDRNFLFALAFEGIVYFIFLGFFDIFSIYCVTVLDIESELFLSNVYCAAMFSIFVYEMLGICLSFFARTENPRKSNKDIIKASLLGILALILIYLTRFMVNFNTYVFLIILDTDLHVLLSIYLQFNQLNTLSYRINCTLMRVGLRSCKESSSNEC